MRFPIKINRSKMVFPFCRLLPSINDPRYLFEKDLCNESFEGAVSSINIDNIWKSTLKRRHPLTDQLIVELLPSFPKVSILEIGASSGTTSLELINRLANTYSRYYVTDLYFTVPYQIQDKATYFYHPKTKHCIMRATDHSVVYEDIQGAFFPQELLTRRLLMRAPNFNPTKSSAASMLHPELKRRVESDSRIVVKEYDMFNAWPGETVDIVKVANVLNRAYFSDKEIKTAISNLKNAIKHSGKLLVTDNRKLEQVSLFSKTEMGNLVLEKELNSGTDISATIKEA
jgi:hypothetical protein